MDNQNEKPSAQSLGGKTRSEKLTAEERSDIARAAAEVRWSKVAEQAGELRLPRATHVGELKIGNIVIPCAVLEDGTRLITQRGMFVALGMNKNPSKGQTAIDNRPGFLSANNLTPYITEELLRSWTPVPFRLPKGRSGGYRGNIAFGYRAEILPMACHVFLDAKEAGVLHKNQKHIADVCKVVHRGFAIVGITALIDEATGYQQIRDRLALQQILRKYISGALYEWSLTFPMEFYKEIFRLKSWEWNNGKMPGVVGRYARDLVYARLAPQVLEELERLNPPTEAGYRKYRHHQYLTRDVGHPALTRRLYELIGMARAFQNWEPYYRLVDKTFPKMNTTLFLPMPDVDVGEEAAS